jgi:hypothetical protein
MSQCVVCEQETFKKCSNKHGICRDCFEGICRTLPYTLHPICPLCRVQFGITEKR